MIEPMPYFPLNLQHSPNPLPPQVLTAALKGSAYPLTDVITSDIQLGQDPKDPSCKPTPKKVADGCKLNMKVVDYLLNADFQLIFLNIGMTASGELTNRLNKMKGCLATSTYHPVLVASDVRNEVTSAAARLTLAAGARLARLALDMVLNAELEAPGLLEIFAELMGSEEQAKEAFSSPRLAVQVKEIAEHEVSTVEKFKVIIRSNGRKYTVTPRVVATSKANLEKANAMNQWTRPANLSDSNHTHFKYYQCPFGLNWCNGRRKCCEECRKAHQRPTAMEERRAAAKAKATEPQMDYCCPEGKAWCNGRSALCSNCWKAKGYSSKEEFRAAQRALKIENVKELQTLNISAGKKPAAPGSL